MAEYPGCNGHRIKSKCATTNGAAHPGKPPKKEKK
jgi:hypothetical protein